MTMQLKKALIVSYYWPPAGGVAVQRWHKFVTYLPEFGYQPIVFTVDDGEFSNYDRSQSDLSDTVEVLREPIMEPYRFYKQFTGKKKDTQINQEAFSEKGPKAKLATWVRGNFFIPDARALWINRSVARLTDYLTNNPVDVLVSNGTPHSCHLIALSLKRKFGLPWLADFRDPWTEVDYFSQLPLMGWAARKHKRLEREVLQEADLVTTVSWTWEKDFKALGAANTATITNGFDSNDFKDLNPEPDTRFTITHLGTLSSYRFHAEFWNCLKETVEADRSLQDRIRIRLVGDVDGAFFKWFKQNGFDQYVEHVPHVDHKNALSIAADSSVLLLMHGDKSKSEGRIPAKVFEYLGARKPILGYGQVPGDVEKIVRETGAGHFVPFDDLSRLKSAIQQLFSDFTHGTRVDPVGIEKFERKDLTRQLAVFLDTLTADK